MVRAAVWCAAIVGHCGGFWWGLWVGGGNAKRPPRRAAVVVVDWV
jgi:hypothetical protein